MKERFDPEMEEAIFRLTHGAFARLADKPWLPEMSVVAKAELRREALAEEWASRVVVRPVSDIPRPDWQEDAYCRIVDGDWFENSSGREVAVCLSCPVRVSCLGFALETGQQHGVWGGLTPEQRKNIA